MLWKGSALCALVSGVVASLSMGAATAAAQNWPTQPIRWIVPYPAGGNTDVVARALADKIAPGLGQPVLIENRGGANTITGTAAMARADDNHTIGLVTDSHSINAAFGRPLPYDSEKDFAPIIHLVRVPLVLVVNPKQVAARTVPDLVSAVKSGALKLRFGSLGNGSPHQIAMEWFRALAGIEVLIVPYRGVAPALNDVIAGHVDAMFNGVITTIEQASAGNIAALGVTSATRSAQLPTVPTIKEQGFPDYELLVWYGVMAPRSMPEVAIMRLNAEINKALRLGESAEKIKGAGGEPVGGTPEEFRQMIVADMARYRRIIEVSGSKPD